MENFEFCISTQIMFGKDQIEKLPEVVNEFGKTVLLTYGGGSIKKMGLYDTIMNLLKDCKVVELNGIAPNPRIESVNEGIKICRENKVDVILAVGGGSVIDCSKAIAAGFYYEGDAWDMIASHDPMEKALPMIAVPTLAATGSEADSGAVITNQQLNEKVGLFSAAIMPKVAIMDPTYTFSVPANQTAAGSADIMSHLMEQYFVPASTFLGDLLVEAAMKTVIKYAPVAMKTPNDYEARAQLLWAGSIGDNATLCNGNQLAAFGVHGMEHPLSGYYDITHGIGLAILTPQWMRFVMKKAPEIAIPRFAHFAKAVWGLKENDEEILAKQAITSLEQFLTELKLPLTLTGTGITDATHFEEMAEKAMYEGLEYAWIPLSKEDVVEIYKMSL